MLSVFVGPIFFLLMEATSAHGIKAGYAVILGAALSDILYISLCYFFVDEVVHLKVHESMLKLFGGIVFMAFGLVYIFKKPRLNNKKTSQYRNYFTKSFLINTLNPSVIFFWLGALSVAVVQYNGDSTLIISCLLLALLVAVLVDHLKMYFAVQLSGVNSRNVVMHINKVTGVGLLAFGAYWIWQTLY